MLIADDFVETRASDAVDEQLLAAEGTVRVSFALKATVACGKCRATLPVNAIVGQIVCPTCGATKKLRTRWWQRVFPERIMQAAFYRRPGAVGRRTAQDKSIEAWFCRRGPLCSHCGQPLPDEALGLVDEASELHCPTCGEAVAVRRPDERAHALCRGAVAVVGEGVQRRVDPNKTEVVYCPNCGGPLSVDGRSARSVPCSYCDASVQLPDNIWLRLHPAQLPREFYLLADFDDKLRWRWLLTQLPAIQYLAHSDIELTPTMARALAKSPVRDARRWAALSGLLPEATLAKLATDEYSEVRLPVAQDERTPVDALVALTSDSSADVRDAAYRNLALPLQRVDAQVVDGPYWVHNAIAHRADLDQLSDAALRSVVTSDAGAQPILNQNPALPAARIMRIVCARREGLYRLPCAGLLQHLPTLDAEARQLLVELGDEQTRCAIAQDPATSNELLHELVKDDSETVARTAKQNPSFKQSFWEKIGL